MTVTGPDFIALQVSDLERSAEFYENALGLRRAPASPPGAVLFATTPIPFAVREPLPGVDLSEAPRPGLGVALWLHCDAVQELQSWPIPLPAPSAAPSPSPIRTATP